MTERIRESDAAGMRLSESGVANTSDELLDDGAHGLRFFREFLPLLADWTGQQRGFGGHVQERYDQLRGIDFAAFREDARLLDAVHQALLADNESMSDEFRAASRTWEGEAAEAAAANVEDHTGAGSAVLDELAAFGGAIPPVIDGIERAVREYARFVLDFAADKCAGRTPDETRAEIRKARGDLQVADLAWVDDVFGFSGYAPSAKGFIAGKGPVPGISGAKEACDEIRRNVVEEAGKWLDTAFKPELQAKLRQFEQQSVSTQECVRRAYDQLLSAVEISENPFRGIHVRPADHTADSSAAGGEDGPQPAGTAPQSADSSPDAEPLRTGDGSAAGTGEPGPASTTPQSAGSNSMSEAGGSVQSTFAGISERLFGGGLTPEQDLPEQEHSVPFGGPPPQSGAIGLATADQTGTGSSRGATGFASISEPDEAQSRQQQSAGSAAGTMGAGMLGLGTMAGDQQGYQQDGDQERPAVDRRAEAWFDVAEPGTTPVFGEDRE